MSRRIASPSTSRCSTTVPPKLITIRFQPVPAMWKSGETPMLTIPWWNPHTGAVAVTIAKKLRLLSIAPFGAPVVPDV